MLLLIINPGSTSTKVSVFDDGENVFTESIKHDSPQLIAFPTTNAQLSFRRSVVEDILCSHGLKFSDIDVFVGRGGCAFSQGAGVMVIDRKLYDDTVADKGGSEHAAKLGVMLAYELGTEFNKPMYTVNPTNVDELDDLARITGIRGLYRRAQTHVLNQKGIAEIHAASLGKRYEECRFIVCHIDGGVTVTAHKDGRMVDSTEGAGGDGPFSPTRLGSIPVLEVLKHLETHSCEEMLGMCSRSGGFVNHFGTNDSDKVHAMIEAGDGYAKLVWDAMVYQICKSVGAMAAVMEGKVDSILLTGGLVRFKDIVDGIKQRCAWIAPITVYPGEVEQEAMADAVLKVLRGEKTASVYSGEPVFKGF